MAEFMGQPRFARSEDGANGHAKNGKNGNGVHEGEEVVVATAAPLSATEVANEPFLRDNLGRFKPGTCGGPGNPYGRAVALLRRVFVERITPEKMAALIDKMYAMSMNGDKGWTNLLLEYVVGKPTAAANPDRVEHEEWEMRREQPHAAEFEEAQVHLPHTMANVLQREADRTKGEECMTQLDERAAADEKQKQKQAERAERRAQKKEQRQRRKQGG